MLRDNSKSVQYHEAAFLFQNQTNAFEDNTKGISLVIEPRGPNSGGIKPPVTHRSHLPQRHHHTSRCNPNLPACFLWLPLNFIHLSLPVPILITSTRGNSLEIQCVHPSSQRLIARHTSISGPRLGPLSREPSGQ